MTLKLNPSAKIHRRYLLLKAPNKEAVDKAIIDYLGILGRAKASPLFVNEKNFSDKIILAVDRKELENIRAAFELSQDEIKIIKVSGTLAGLNRQRRHRRDKL